MIIVAALVAPRILAEEAVERPRPATNLLTVMTFNLRYASVRPPNAWPARRPAMGACIRELAPDLIGTQEGLYTQLRELSSDLPDYEWLGLGRDGGSKGEFMAIFYRRERFEPLEYDHFWLSDTPQTIASSTWGNENRRMVTWIRFKDKQVGREFYFWNTHLDHAIQEAREKGARLIWDRVSQLKVKLPILLVGDFNATARANPAYDILVQAGRFQDTWYQTDAHRNGEISSFHGFKGPREGGERIDWILADGPWKVQATEVVTFQKNNEYPSDHFPVVSWLVWPTEP